VSRRGKRRDFPPGELMLAAMVDMMINILIFLLTLYGTDPIDVQPSADLVVPSSHSKDPVEPGVSMVVTRRAVLVDGVEVAALGAEKPSAAALSRLQDELVKRLVPEADGAPPELSVQCDHRVPWDVLGPVLGVAQDAGYGRFRFVVRQED
jgi:biopolymer transport protein ExbD